MDTKTLKIAAIILMVGSAIMVLLSRKIQYGAPFFTAGALVMGYVERASKKDS